MIRRFKIRDSLRDTIFKLSNYYFAEDERSIDVLLHTCFIYSKFSVFVFLVLYSCWFVLVAI